MATEDMKFTEEGLKESIKNGDMETIERFVSLSGEDILSQLGVDGQYDDLLDAAVDTGNLEMVKMLLKRSNLIQSSMDNFIDGLDENDSEEIKEELRKFAGLEKRSNLQTYKGKWKEWQTGLKKAEENGYDDLAEKLKNRMDFEDNRRLEMEGKRPKGTSENRWFLNENSWTLNGKGGLEYPMYGQDNAETIREELKQAGIETEETHYDDKKTNSSTNYRIRIKSEDKEKLKQFLEQKRQEKEDLEAIVSGHEEEESSNDTHEEVVFIDPKPQKEPSETWVPPVVNEESIVEQPKQNQGEKDMPINKTDYYYADPELETADYLAEHTSVDIKKEKKAGPELKVTDDMVFADPDLESVENEVKTTSADIKTAVNPVENNAEQPENAVENPQAEVVVNPEQPKAEKVQTTVRNTFRDLNNLDAHMPIGQVLARLEDVEFKENETQKKELFDEIKRQYQLKRENPDYKVQGLNGRINSTDMLKFAQHIDNVIDDGEPDNIDYTQGHTEKIRSLATLDRHLQISEVLARLEDVAAKTQDPNEQALLDLVREGYEEKRKSPENDLSGLNSFVDSTAALNLAKRIDLAIDDGEIENVDCLIMDTVQVNDSEKAEEKNIVQDNVKENTAKTPQKENLPPNKFQRINIDPNDLPTPEETPVSTESTVENEVVSPENSKGEEPFSVDVGVAETSEDEKPFTVEGPGVTGSEAETDERISATVGAAETEKESEGMKNGPGFWANWHKYPNYKFMSTNEGKSFHARPYYFNPSELTEEEKELARHMLAEAGVKIDEGDEVEAPLNFKGPLPIKEGEKVWRVTGNDNIKKLKKFLNECQKDEDKALGKKVRLVKPAEEDEKSVDWKGGAKKALGVTGKAIKGTGEYLGKGVKAVIESDVAKSLNATMDKFNESVFKTGLSDPEQFASNMMVAMLAFPFDFLDIYLQTKADKYKTAKSEDKAKPSPGFSDDKERQHKALKNIMNEMVKKDPELFEKLAENGVLGNSTDDRSQEERAENAKQFFKQPENEELMNRLKGAFAEVTKEKPGWIQAIYPTDYKGSVTPDVLLNHVMGWGNSVEASADRTVVPPTADRTVVPPTGPALSPEMQAIMQQMQLLTAEIQGLREEVAQLRQENAQLKEQMLQQQAENDKLKSENDKLRAELEAYRSGKVKPEVINEAEQPKTAAEDVKPIEQNKKEFSFPDLNKLGSLNNLNETMARNIMDDDVPGFKETASMTPEQLAQSPKAQFFNKVRSAYSTGEKPAGLNDLIQTSEQAGWAEELAHAVENDNGNNVPRITKDLIVTSKSEVEKPEISKTPETVVQTPVVDATKTEPAKTEVETLSQSAPTKEEKTVDAVEPKKDQLTPAEEKQPVVASENQMTPAQVKEMIRDFFQELEKNGYSLQKADVVVQKVASAEIETKTTKKKEQVQKKQETAKKLVEKTEKLSKKKDTLTKAQREFVQSHLGLQGIDLNKKQDGFVYKDDGQELSDHAIKQVVGHETKGKYATKTGLIELFQKLHTLDKEVAAQYGFEFKEVKVAQATVKRSRKSSAVQKTQISKTTAEKSSTSQNVSGQMVDKFLKSSRN